MDKQRSSSLSAQAFPKEAQFRLSSSSFISETFSPPIQFTSHPMWMTLPFTRHPPQSTRTPGSSKGRPKTSSKTVNLWLSNLTKTKSISYTSYPNFKLAPDNIVEHSKTVKWLGILFNNTLSFKQHILERIKKAKGAFFRLQRLTNTERGLSAFAVRQLYLACINSVATYGAELYWRQQVWVEKSF